MRHPRSLFLLWLLALTLACGGSYDAWKDITRVPGRTEVAILGTLHGPLRHDDEGAYPIPLLRTLLRTARPDVVMVEVPPARFEAVQAAIAQGRPDEWLDSFPELPAVFAEARAANAELVPISGWTGESTAAWKRYWRTHPGGPEGDAHEQAAGQLARVVGDEGADPWWIHGPRYRRLTRWVASTLVTYAKQELGPASPDVACARHRERLHAALAEHEGKRAVVVFDARRRWCLETKLPADVRLIDTRGFLDAFE